MPKCGAFVALGMRPNVDLSPNLANVSAARAFWRPHNRLSHQNRNSRSTGEGVHVRCAKPKFVIRARGRSCSPGRRRCMAAVRFPPPRSGEVDRRVSGETEGADATSGVSVTCRPLRLARKGALGTSPHAGEEPWGATCATLSKLKFVTRGQRCSRSRRRRRCMAARISPWATSSLCSPSENARSPGEQRISRGQGLIAKGGVTEAKATPRKRGVVRQTPRVSITVKRTAPAKRAAGPRRTQTIQQMERRPARDRTQFQILSPGHKQDRRHLG